MALPLRNFIASPLHRSDYSILTTWSLAISTLYPPSANKFTYGTFTSEFLDVRVCWTVLYPQAEYVGLSYILKALFTNNRGGCKTVQHCLTYSNIILTSKNSDVNVPLVLASYSWEIEVGT